VDRQDDMVGARRSVGVGRSWPVIDSRIRAVPEPPVVLRNAAVWVVGTATVESHDGINCPRVRTVGIGRRWQIAFGDNDLCAVHVGPTLAILHLQGRGVGAGCGVGVARDYPVVGIAIPEVPGQGYEEAVRIAGPGAVEGHRESHRASVAAVCVSHGWLITG